MMTTNTCNNFFKPFVHPWSGEGFMPRNSVPSFRGKRLYRLRVLHEISNHCEEIIAGIKARRPAHEERLNAQMKKIKALKEAAQQQQQEELPPENWYSNSKL